MAPVTGAPDVVVVGAGIVGLATARALLAASPGLDVVVLEAADDVATHQSGRNSGVVHAGLYYRPGSAKARLCTQGREELEAYCRERGVPHERPGKLVVATSVAELDRLAELARRAAANGVAASTVSRAGIAEREPHVDGVAALWVPATGVVDYVAVCRALVADVEAAGGTIRLATEVRAIDEGPDAVRMATSDGPVTARRLVNCAGLHADLVADAAARGWGMRIVAFRGEYATLAPHRAHLVRGLVYPVPDPALPFLGVHFTRGIDGEVHVGPNAVAALGRHAYTWRRSDPRELVGLARDPAVRALARRWWRAGAGELARSASRRRFAAAARRLVPDLAVGDLRPAPAGIRAQAVADDGTLLDDFVIRTTARCVHVLNAPSPAATASLAIGAHLASLVEAPRPPGPS
jgi:L-2-hydroxyglutarate oxidase